MLISDQPRPCKMLAKSAAVAAFPCMPLIRVNKHTRLDMLTPPTDDRGDQQDVDVPGIDPVYSFVLGQDFRHVETLKTGPKALP